MFGYERNGVAQFDRVANYYDRFFGRSSPKAHHIIVEFLKTEERPKRVLDVGSGTGLLLQAILQESAEPQNVFGIDPAPRMVQVARERLPEATFVQGTVEALPWDDYEFDLVVSSESFGHWRDQGQGMREIHRVLKPSGLTVIVEHQPPRGIRRQLFWIAGTLPRYRQAKEMANLACELGFEVIASHDRGGYTVTALRKDCGK
jgi:ubiquinone/menaquinone biosynthesis C-methylase UbiE